MSRKSTTEQMKKYIEKFFVLYIFIQPILDISVYFGLPISNIVRVGALFIGFIYFFCYPNKRIKLLSIVYFVVLGLFMLIHFINNYQIKNPYFFIEELTYGVKSVYVVAILVIYAAVFHSIKKEPEWELMVQRYITFNMIVIGIIMLIASLTGTGKDSYDMLVKEGHSGWFFSANELSAILAMGFGIMLIYVFNIKNLRKKLTLTPFVILVSWSMLTIGTKVGLLSLFALAILGLILSLFDWLVKKQQIYNAIFFTIIIVVSAVLVPYSPVGNNLNITFLENEQQQPTEQKTASSNGNIENVSESSKATQSKSFIKKALSGRDFFFRMTLEDYKEASLSQKLFGMGPGGNYEKRLIIIEMDFFDWFFSYGIVGFIILFAPILVFGITIVKKLLLKKLKQVNYTWIMVAYEIALAVGISMFAGHIFLNPASGIYFAILYSYLFNLTLSKIHGVQSTI